MKTTSYFILGLRQLSAVEELLYKLAAAPDCSALNPQLELPNMMSLLSLKHG